MIHELGAIRSVPIKGVHSGTLRFRDLRRSYRHARKTIIIGTIADDFHSLGKNMTRRFLVPYFDVIDLGTNVKAEIFVEEAIKHKVAVICCSAVMYNAVMNIREVRIGVDSYTKWEKKPRILVGGAPFNMNPTLYRQVGADMYSESAFGAVKAVSRLIESWERKTQ